MTTLAQLMAGIRQEESGGNYQATNSIGALGAYQVMSSNLASWSMQVLGYSISASTFLSSPSLQDQIVTGILGKYYNEYGAAGAAAMWFSGQPNPNSSASDGSTTVSKYVANVLNYAGNSSGTVSASDASGNSNVSAAVDPQTLAEEYGFTSSFLNANPELKSIFNQAVSGQWSADKFKAALMNTNWWKSHSSTERDYLTQAATDPATAKQTYNQAMTHAAQLMDGLGLTQTAYGKTYNSTLSALAYNIAAKGWTDDQAKYYAGQYLKLTNGRMYGDAETQYSNGLQYAYSMGVTMSNDWYSQQVRNIERGIGTFADLQQGIRQQAIAQFPQFSQQINGGQTVQDLASPYISEMGNVLEINSQTLSAFDPTIKKALTYKDPTTGITGAQPIWQFDNSLRENDPRWLQTNNARDSMMTAAHGVLQSFGFSI
jgi:hypothetical protein